MDELNTYFFELRETTVRSADVTAPSLSEARRMMREQAAGQGRADMGGEAPIQLGDIRSVKVTFRLIGDLTHG